MGAHPSRVALQAEIERLRRRINELENRWTYKQRGMVGSFGAGAGAGAGVPPPPPPPPPQSPTMRRARQISRREARQALQAARLYMRMPTAPTGGARR